MTAILRERIDELGLDNLELEEKIITANNKHAAALEAVNQEH